MMNTRTHDHEIETARARGTRIGEGWIGPKVDGCRVLVIRLAENSWKVSLLDERTEHCP